jgi:hypothetical protein
MKKCNICGIEITQFSEQVICDNCENNNKPSIENQNLELILVIGFLIIGIIYTYGGYYSMRYKDPLFENNIYWIVVDLIGCWLVYKWNWTDGIILSEGTGPFFGIPILTILGLINFILLPNLPRIFTELFYSIVSFPPLNFFVGLTCLYTSLDNIKGLGKK